MRPLPRAFRSLTLAGVVAWACATAEAQSPTVAESQQAPAITEANALGAEVVRLYGAGAYAQATPLAERALTLREGALGPEHPDVATSLNNLAALYEAQGAYDRAEPLFQRALRLREKDLGPEHPDVATSLNNLAELYRAQGAYSQAEPLLLRALRIFEKALGPEHSHVATSLSNLAALYQAQGAYGRAEPLLQRAWRIREKALGPEHPLVATSLNNLAALYEAQGAYDRAEPLFQRALRLREKALGPEHPDVATSLNNLAALYEARGAHGQAEPLFQRALRLREKALGPEHPAVATSLNNLAELYRAQGAYAKAEPLLQRALRLREKDLGPEHPLVAASLNNLAELYRAQGAYAQAEPLYQRALHIQEKGLGPEHPLVAASLNNLAELYRAQGAYAQAEPLYQRALRIQEEALGPEHPAVATSLNNLAGLYDSQGAYSKAEPLFQRALRIQEKALGPEHPAVATSLNNLAGLYDSQGAYSKAEPLYQRTLRLWEKALGPEHPHVATSLHNLAALYQAQNDPRRALALTTRAMMLQERFLRTEIGTLEEQRKRSVLQTLRGTLDWAASFHAHDTPDNPEALRLALTMALWRKSRVLEELAGDRAALRAHLTPALQAEVDALAAQQVTLAALHDAARPEQAAATRALAAEVDEREAALRRQNATFRAQTTPVTIEAVQRALPADAALVEFVRYQRFDVKKAKPWQEAHYVAYVLRHDGPPQWAALGEAAPIEAAVRHARRALAEHRDDGYLAFTAAEARQALRALDALVYAPLQRALGATPHLLLSPDGALNTVPFEALVDEQGRYRLQTTRITYLGSGRDVLRMGERRPARSGPLLLAAPDYGSGDQPFGRLRGALDEATAAQGFFPGASLQTGAQATREALLNAKGPRFVLLATHGFLRHPGLPAEPDPRPTPPPPRRGTILQQRLPPDETGDPEQALERAGLAMAGANQSLDAIVSGKDLATLDLGGTKLVVLSACETGLGRLQDGEGVYGLRRALAIAGAESQVVSLWNVDDAATGQLMSAYFGALRAGQGRSEALRQARLGLLGQPRYEHPFYWAAFVPAGDWRPLEGGADPPPPLPVQGTCGCRVAGAQPAGGGAGAALVGVVAALAWARRRDRRAPPSGAAPTPSRSRPAGAAGTPEQPCATPRAPGAS